MFLGAIFCPMLSFFSSPSLPIHFFGHSFPGLFCLSYIHGLSTLCPALRPPFLLATISSHQAYFLDIPPDLGCLMALTFLYNCSPCSFWEKNSSHNYHQNPMGWKLSHPGVQGKTPLSPNAPVYPSPSPSPGRSRQISRSPPQPTGSWQRNMGRVAQTPQQGPTITPMAMGTIIVRRRSLALPSLRRQPTQEP